MFTLNCKCHKCCTNVSPATFSAEIDFLNIIWFPGCAIKLTWGIGRNHNNEVLGANSVNVFGLY